MQDNSLTAYESRNIKTHEWNYDVYDLELVVVLHALKMSRNYFLGKKLTWVSNHISVIYIFNEPYLNARQERWMAFLS